MKRVMVEAALGANFFIKRTMARAFSAAGYNVFFWQKEGKSCYDAFTEFKPDIFIGQTWSLDRALVKNLSQTEGLKVMLSANHYGSGDKDIDKSLFPIEFASDSEKGWVEELLKNGVSLWGMCQYNEKYTYNTHNLWNNLGFHVNGIMLSVDVTNYFPTEVAGFNNDIVFVGGKWAYKSVNLDKYISPLLFPNTSWRIKVFGSGWSSPNCLGRADESTIRNFYASSVISPNIFEPHSIEFGADVNQRSYEIGACGGFQISQRVKSLEEDMYNDNEIVFVDTPEEFFEKVIYYLNNPEETIPFRQAALRTIMGSHTNLHRGCQIAKIMGEDCSAFMGKIDEISERFCDAIN